jgi:hypothetical protein
MDPTAQIQHDIRRKDQQLTGASGLRAGRSGLDKLDCGVRFPTARPVAVGVITFRLELAAACVGIALCISAPLTWWPVRLAAWISGVLA